MPTYDYECDSCGTIIEIVQSFQDSPQKKCPECGKLKMRRLISGGAGLMFKGSGFYVTDSNTKNNVSTKDSNVMDAKSTEKTINDTVPTAQEAKSTPDNKSSTDKVKEGTS